MRVILKAGLIVVAAETDEDRAALAVHVASVVGHVFHLVAHGERGFALHDLGARETACREPINVTSRHADAEIRLIGNFAPTPFVLDGVAYGSVEGFWQSLKFDDAAARRRVARLVGGEAKRAGDAATTGDFIRYGDTTVRIGRAEHWALMHRACLAKFAQNEAARNALTNTWPRPLQHRMRRDSGTIPGVVMADIWQRIRDGFLAGAAS